MSPSDSTESLARSGISFAADASAQLHGGPVVSRVDSDIIHELLHHRDAAPPVVTSGLPPPPAVTNGHGGLAVLQSRSQPDLRVARSVGMLHCVGACLRHGD